MAKRDELNTLAFGYAAAAVGGLGMLVLGIFGNIGIYGGAVSMMQQWHMFFGLSIGGMIAGIIEGAVWSFVGGYALAWFYNKFA